jgi:hypothetical protein
MCSVKALASGFRGNTKGAHVVDPISVKPIVKAFTKYKNVVLVY